MNLEVLEKYYADGLLHKQLHPLLDLTVWNYTPKVQYERLWDDVTKNCRGLVTDSKGNIVARCLPKFFNMEELSPTDIPNEPFTVTEKVDGSYISVFYYNDQWIVASRGSFISDQSIKAREILFSKYNVEYGLYPGYTYIMEVIYPENRIVVDYGDVEKLIVITAFKNDTGKEVSIKEMTTEGFEIVKSFDAVDDYREIKSMIGDDQEGYVVRFKNGFRMKIKGNEYVRLHRILTNISNRDIWRYLKDGKPLDEILEKVPDEFYHWVKDTEESLKTMFETTKILVESMYYNHVSEDMSRKEVAEYVLTLPRNFHAPMFLLFDKKDISSIVWERLYPKYEKPFKKINDDEA